MKKQNKITIQISPAELMDKISILEVKLKKITNPDKRKNILFELGILKKEYRNSIIPSAKLNKLFQKLKKLSAKGWDIEDRKRICESENNFGQEFINAAREAFKNNDERAKVWRQINLLLKSEIIQEKEYSKY